MKKLIFTLGCCSLLILNALNANIHYENFGDGWHIGLNENIVVDLDSDNIDDFYINGWEDELGFVPIFGQGCFGGTGLYTDFNSNQLVQAELEQFIHMSSLPYFIDDDRGSILNSQMGDSELWVNHQDYYIGFMIFSTGSYGWMRLSVDKVLNVLTIKEWAWEDEYNVGIFVGDTGESVVSINDLSNLSELKIFPNPAMDKVALTFNYASDQSLSLEVVNAQGQIVLTSEYGTLATANTLQINTSTLTNGMYFIRLRNSEGIKVKRLIVAK